MILCILGLNLISAEIAEYFSPKKMKTVENVNSKHTLEDKVVAVIRTGVLCKRFYLCPVQVILG